MGRAGHALRAGSVSAGLLLMVTACGLMPFARDESRPPSGPPPEWSTELPDESTDRLDGGDPVAAVAGSSLVVTSGSEIRGYTLDGRETWRSEFPSEAYLSVAGELAVVYSDEVGVRVIDAENGDERWRDSKATELAVFADAVYSSRCNEARDGAPDNCRVTARDLSDGTVRWDVPAAQHAQVRADAVGVPYPQTQPAARRLALVTMPDGLSGDRWVNPIDARTGKPLGRRAEFHTWYAFVAGDVMVVTDHDNEPGCGVAIRGYDIEDGSQRWSTVAQDPKRAHGDCDEFLAPPESGMDVIGDGHTIAAVNDSGKPQLIDLRTGRTTWTAPEPGAPVAGSGRLMLARTRPDQGRLRLYDTASGGTLWTAPDPGLDGYPSVVHRDAVLVAAECDAPAIWCIVRYDVATGDRKAAYPGSYAGSGDGWVATYDRDEPGDGWRLEFHTY